MKIIGHRGAKGLAPENTIASLRKAVQHNVDMLEFDLRVTRDQIPILIHDPYLTDPSGQKLKVADHSYAELRAHKPDLSTFADMLEAIGHPATLYTEVKPGEPTKPIIDVIQRQLENGWKAEHFALASFSQRVLRELHAALPDIPIVVLEKWSSVRARRRANELGTKTISMKERWLWPLFITACKRGGWDLYAWTINDPKKARRWQKAGLAGVVTDYPDLFEKA